MSPRFYASAPTDGGALAASVSDVRCGPRKFLLFSAKDLVANDAKKLDATMIKDLAGYQQYRAFFPDLQPIAFVSLG